MLPSFLLVIQILTFLPSRILKPCSEYPEDNHGTPTRICNFRKFENLYTGHIFCDCIKCSEKTAYACNIEGKKDPVPTCRFGGCVSCRRYGDTCASSDHCCGGWSRHRADGIEIFAQDFNRLRGICSNVTNTCDYCAPTNSVCGYKKPSLPCCKSTAQCILSQSDTDEYTCVETPCNLGHDRTVSLACKESLDPELRYCRCGSKINQTPFGQCVPNPRSCQTCVQPGGACELKTKYNSCCDHLLGIHLALGKEKTLQYGCVNGKCVRCFVEEQMTAGFNCLVNSSIPCCPISHDKFPDTFSCTARTGSKVPTCAPDDYE